jgi:CRISPR-associated protein Cmr4
VGCGRDVGVVDLPVIRRRTAGYPIIPGSGIRGPFRDLCERKASAMASRLFGTENNENAEKADQAGCVIVNDARILLFPVRSHPGVFHWITCPFVLARYAADAKYFGGSASPFGGLPDPGEDTYAGKTEHSPLVLEEFPSTARVNGSFRSTLTGSRRRRSSWSA